MGETVAKEGAGGATLFVIESGKLLSRSAARNERSSAPATTSVRSPHRRGREICMITAGLNSCARASPLGLPLAGAAERNDRRKLLQSLARRLREAQDELVDGLKNERPDLHCGWTVSVNHLDPSSSSGARRAPSKAGRKPSSGWSSSGTTSWRTSPTTTVSPSWPCDRPGASRVELGRVRGGKNSTPCAETRRATFQRSTTGLVGRDRPGPRSRPPADAA